MQEKVASIDLSRICKFDAVSVGQIEYISNEGVAYVDFPGNSSGAVRARSLIADRSVEPRLREGEEKPKVLLMFENANPNRPIIVGFINDKVLRENESDPNLDSSQSLKQLYFEGERLIFDARQEVMIRCGKSSISLQRDGKIVIKGATINSRASKLLKLKGSMVTIN